jgi:acyl-CoA synthetase (NDP forming)
MSVRNLRDLFNPRSVAVIGASERRYSVGATVLRNLSGSSFKGAIYPVNPKYDVLAGLAQIRAGAGVSLRQRMVKQTAGHPCGYYK